MGRAVTWLTHLLLALPLLLAALLRDEAVRQLARRRRRRRVAGPRRCVPPEAGAPPPSLASLVEAVVAGRTSAAALVGACEARFRECNAHVNAIVVPHFAEARLQAQHVDELPPCPAAPCACSQPCRRALAASQPLLGIPFTAKECFAVRGCPNTSGLVARIGRPAATTATAVQRMRDAGAILVGLTNVSELCMWLESSNQVYGRTNNAYDVECMVGGSSGGEGCALAAAMSLASVGSDVGGSIRLPAHFNGVFGLKPTGGRVPNTGQWPGLENEAYLVTGPLARRAADLELLLGVLAGPDGIDRACPDPPRFPLGRSADVGQLRVFRVSDDSYTRLARRPSPVVACAVDDAFQRLARDSSNGGVCVQMLDFRASVETWATMLTVRGGGPPFAHFLGDEQPMNVVAALLHYLVRPSSCPHTLPALGLATIEVFSGATPSLDERIIAAGTSLRVRLNQMLADDGILVFPTFPSVAPRHGDALRSPFDFAFTAIFNALELPVAVVPVGHCPSTGLPVGVQLVAAQGCDHVAIAAAIRLEAALAQ